MNSRTYARFALIAILVSCCPHDSCGQSRETDRGQQEIEANRSRIGDQRVARQAEIARLEQIIERLQSRVTRLERQLMGPNQFPVISVVEAQATLEFAEPQLRETEQRFKKGLATETQVTGDRVAVVRARAQVDIAAAAQDDRTHSLELDVTHAEHRLADTTARQAQLEQLVAKGYAPAKALDVQQLEVTQAQQELVRARARLAFQQQVAAERAKPAEADE